MKIFLFTIFSLKHAKSEIERIYENPLVKPNEEPVFPEKVISKDRQVRVSNL